MTYKLIDIILLLGSIISFRNKEKNKNIKLKPYHLTRTTNYKKICGVRLMQMINYTIYTKLGKKEIYLPKAIYDRAFSYIEPRGLLEIEREYARPIEEHLLQKIGYILEYFKIPLTSRISLENYMSNGYKYDIDIIVDGIKKLSLNSFKKINCGEILIEFTIKEGEHEGYYLMPIKYNKIEERKRIIGPITYIQEYNKHNDNLTSAFFNIQIPNSNQELTIEIHGLKMDDKTLSIIGANNIIAVLNSITSQPNFQKKYTLLDISAILKENTKIFDATNVIFKVRNITNKTDICKLNVERGNLKDFKLDLFSSNNEFIELTPEIKANRTETRINRIYTYTKDIYIEDTLKIGTLTVSRDEKGKIKTEFQLEEEISNEIVDAYISYQFPKDVFASLSMIANYVKQTKDFANLKSHKLGVSTNLNDIIEHLGKDEYGVCIIDGEQLIYASPLDQNLEVNEHNQLVEKILKEAYPYCNPKEKKTKCIIVEFYKGSYDVRNNDISLILPNRFEIGNRQIAGLLIFLEQIKYATYLGTRTISCNKLNNVKYSVKDMCDFIQELSTQGYDYREHIPTNPLGIPLDNLFKVCHEPYLIKLLKPTD